MFTFKQYKLITENKWSDNRNGYVYHNFDVGPHKVEVVYGRRSQGHKSYNVDFRVNGTTRKEKANVPPEDRMKILTSVRASVSHFINTRKPTALEPTFVSGQKKRSVFQKELKKMGY